MQRSPAIVSALLDDVGGGKCRVLEQRPGRRLRIGAARADRDDAELGLEHVARAGDDERRAAVRHSEHRLEPAQDAIRTPILRELDRGARELTLVFLELGFEALEQRERVGRRSGEAREHAVVVQAAHLARRGLDHDVAERHLAVAAERSRRRRAGPRGSSCRERFPWIRRPRGPARPPGSTAPLLGLLDEVARRNADQQQQRPDDRRRADDLHRLALRLDRD